MQSQYEPAAGQRPHAVAPKHPFEVGPRLPACGAGDERAATAPLDLADPQVRSLPFVALALAAALWARSSTADGTSGRQT